MPLQPVVDQSNVYVNRTFDWQSPTGTDIKAFDLATGAERWAVQLPPSGALEPHTSRPIAVRDGRVYAARSGYPMGASYLYALDSSTGATLWTSADKVDLAFAVSPVFAANGDLIVNGESDSSLSSYTLLRIDVTDGSTIWRTANGSGGVASGGVIVAGKYYRMANSGSGSRLARIDLATGAKLYESAVLLPGSHCNSDLMAGFDGTIYCPMTDLGGPASDFFFALEDTGTGFTVRWSIPMADIFWSSFGQQPDGSIICYSELNELLRIDPLNGVVLDRSVPMNLTPSMVRVAVDAAGSIYMTAGESGPGPQQVLAYDSHLNWLWSENLSSVTPASGPVLGPDGQLIVSTLARVVRTWENPTSCNSQNYCLSQVNSTGSPAQIGRTGTLSIQIADLNLTANDLPANQPGLFYYGPNQTQLPFGNGYRCVSGQLFRLSPTVSDAGGAALFDLDFQNPPAPGGLITAGSNWNFQYWYRDPAGGGFFFNLTDAMAISFCP